MHIGSACSVKPWPGELEHEDLKMSFFSFLFIIITNLEP